MSSADIAIDNAPASESKRASGARKINTLWLLTRIVLIAIPVLLAAMIAHTSMLYAHADEDMHIDAFRYFETHWTPPELGSREVNYSSMGWSRVFTGEIVYPVYGRLGALLGPHYESLTETIYPKFERLTHLMFAKLGAISGPWDELDEPKLRSETEGIPPEPVRMYRYFNVCLLLVTLIALFFTPCRWINLSHLALLLICIPQVIYVFAYANSDAWGLAFSVLLFAQTANLLDYQTRSWPWYRIALWMLTALGLLLSKTDFLLGLFLPIILLIVHFIRDRRRSPGVIWYVTRFAIPIAAIVVLAGMWSPGLSIRRSEWNQKVIEMREETASEGRKPSDPYLWNYYLASKGVTYREMLQAKGAIWMRRCLQSFYGQFGGWTVRHRADLYDRAWVLGVIALAFTLLAQLLFRARESVYLLVGLLLAPILIALNFYGTLYYSLHIDFQPQGRYLFPALVPLFFLTLSTTRIENRYYRWAHLLVFVPLLAMSLYTLLYYGAWEPDLQNSTYWSRG